MMNELTLPLEHITFHSEKHYFRKNKSGLIHYRVGFESVRSFWIIGDTRENGEYPEYSSLYFDDYYDKHGFGVMGYVEINFEEILEELALPVYVGRSARNDALHRRMKKNVDYFCQICGEQFTGTGELVVHHINSVWNDNPSNLLVCCHSCHPIMEE